MTQPSLAALTPAARLAGRPLVGRRVADARPRPAGTPGLPGTTLNSPSQLQMALMTRLDLAL